MNQEFEFHWSAGWSDRPRIEVWNASHPGEDDRLVMLGRAFEGVTPWGAVSRGIAFFLGGLDALL